MRARVAENIRKGRYADQGPSLSAPSYVNKGGGWTEYLLSDRILFSHRENDYTRGAFSKRLHTHDHYELTVVVSGEGVEYIADGKSVALKRGMAILTKPNKFHLFRLSAPTHYDRYVLYFKAPEDLFPDDRVVDFTRMGNSVSAIFAFSEAQAISYTKMAEEALSLADSPYASAKAYLALCGLFLALSDQSAIVEGNADASLPKFIREIKQYIDENFLRISSVEALAAKFFYSREFVSRSFKQYYNTPVYEYILGRRLLHCASLLRKGEGVEAAARASGFSNMSSFIKLFRKYHSCSPSEYKNKDHGK